ncbi:MAG: histidine kinase dimerization/phospho-acceptor domain-containing protein, partial [Myxococcota bacterium]
MPTQSNIVGPSVDPARTISSDQRRDPVPTDDPVPALRKVLRVGIATCVASVPVLWTALGLAPALAIGFAISAAFWVILHQLDRGEVDRAIRWSTTAVACTVAVGLVLLGGLSGWVPLFCTTLPMYAVLFGRPRTAVGIRTTAFVWGLVALVWVLPDVWLVPVSPGAIDPARLVFGLMAIAGTGAMATYAVRRFEGAIEAAMVTETEARAAIGRKRTFLANLSHELRTPMNAIIGYSELVLEGAPESDGRREDVERIRELGQALLALINDVLEHARSEATGGDALRHTSVAHLVAQLTMPQGPLEAAPLRDERVATTMVKVAPGELKRLVGEVVQGFRQLGHHQLLLDARLLPDAVALRIAVADGQALRPARTPVEWLLAEQSCRTRRLRFVLADDGSVELRLRGASATASDEAGFLDWPLGLSPTPLPDDPLEALRVRLSLR